jgi:hypothetical protein
MACTHTSDRVCMEWRWVEAVMALNSRERGGGEGQL